MLAMRGSGQPRLVYQCLDIHRLMTAQGPAGRLARWVERRVLARTSLLVVSAPRFLSEYFVSRQGYHGPVQVMENRIVWSTSADAPPRPVCLPKRPDGPITIGWVGTLRCPQTLDLLQSAVEQAGPQTLRVVLRGVVHHHQLPGFDRRIGATPGLSYEGPYKYPAGLKSAYDGLDYVWAQDLWQRGANSDWLLPNRLYEAGYFGCPMLALTGTATGDRVRSWRSGITLPNARPEDLEQAVPQLRALRNELARNLLALPAATFAQDKGEVATMLGLVDSKRSDRSDATPIADRACASRAHIRQGWPAGT
jgi:succinoglycan biosynthesis protein ExoL